MKKLIFVLAILFVGMAASAQIYTANLAEGNTYWEYTTDVTLTNTTAQYFQINAPKDYYTAQNYVVWIDSASGNHTNVAIALYGRISDMIGIRGGGVGAAQSTNWTQIGSTINWKGASGDTVIIFANATENAYREYKLLFTGTGTGTSTIKNTEFKLWYGLP